MTQMQQLRLFISERLSAAAEEIFAAVQRTITERSPPDGQQHGLKQEARSHGEDTPQLFAFAHEQTHLGQEWSPESCHNDPGADREDCDLLVPEPPVIKQEQPWSSPEGPQPLDTEDADTSTLKVTLASIKSCISSDVTELETHDTGNEDRKPVANTSADHRTVEGNVQTSSGCWTPLPDCSVTLNNKQNDKPFVCGVCGKEFRQGNSVAVHMRIHTEEKPYRCRICGKEFRHVGNLNVHTRIHTGEKPYTCTVCGKKFSRNNLMKKHLAVHAGETSPSMESVLRRGFVGMTS